MLWIYNNHTTYFSFVFPEKKEVKVNILVTFIFFGQSTFDFSTIFPCDKKFGQPFLKGFKQMSDFLSLFQKNEQLELRHTKVMQSLWH